MRNKNRKIKYFIFNIKQQPYKMAAVFLIGVFRRGNKPPVLLGEDKNAELKKIDGSLQASRLEERQA